MAIHVYFAVSLLAIVSLVKAVEKMEKAFFDTEATAFPRVSS